MKKLIIYIILICFLLAAILFGHHAIGEKGRIFIAMGDWRIQMSVVSAGIVLFFSAVAVTIIWWVIKRLAKMLIGSRDWFGSLSRKKQQKAYFAAINACAIGDYEGAHKAINRTFPGEFGGSNYILAADIDRKINGGKKVANLLQIAETFPESSVAAKAQHAAWLLQQHQFSEAKEVLESIDPKARKQGVIVRLWLSIHAALGRWDEVKATLASSKKILGDDYVNWAQQAVQGEFSEIASKEGANALMQKWHNLPRAAKKDVANQIVYIQQLINQGLSKDAEPVLVELAKKSHNSAFYNLFKQLDHPSPHKAMRLIESWIKADPEDAKLYSVLAHLAYNSGDDELAEKAVRKALELASDPEDGRLLAILLEKQNAFERANTIYKGLITN